MLPLHLLGEKDQINVQKKKQLKKKNKKKTKTDH